MEKWQRHFFFCGNVIVGIVVAIVGVSFSERHEWILLLLSIWLLKWPGLSCLILIRYENAFAKENVYCVMAILKLGFSVWTRAFIVQSKRNALLSNRIENKSIAYDLPLFRCLYGCCCCCYCCKPISKHKIQLYCRNSRSIEKCQAQQKNALCLRRCCVFTWIIFDYVIQLFLCNYSRLS